MLTQRIASLARLVQRLPGQGRPILLTIVFGLAGGLGAVAFQAAMNGLYRVGLFSLSHRSATGFALGSLAVIVATSLVVGFLLTHYAPGASGSGIPQLKLAFWKDFGVVPWRVVWVKFVAGVLSIGGGCSLGREGPSVQLSGSLASHLAGLLGEPKQNRRMAAAAGAAAGLAAAFNTPLAAVTFVLEEIIGDLNSRLLGGVLVASVIGALCVHAFIGQQPAFALRGVQPPSWYIYILTPVVASVAALVGVAFQKWTMWLRLRRKAPAFLPVWARPAAGGVITWALGLGVFLGTNHLGVFGLGYDDLSAGLAHQLGWGTAGLLLAAKLVATVACYGLGGCGGIFSPTLFLGGMCGLVLSGLWTLAFPLSAPDQLTLAVVGMSACLGAVVRAPVTGILIVFEMTHQFALVPALMLGALASQAISRRLCRHSFYDEILIQDGHRLERVIPPRDLHGWEQLPISAIANFNPVSVCLDSPPADLRAVLQSHPYQRFPALSNGRLVGVAARQELDAALAEGRPPKPEPAVTCLPGQTIRHLQGRLVESTSLIAILIDHPDGKVLGLVTLHDLLRAQAAMAGPTAAS